MARVTLAHVAEAAGVTKATVSRALRGDSRISRATVERVWSCARQLGYRADAVARSLSGQPTGLVALCLKDWSRPWTSAFLARVLYVLDRYQLQALVTTTQSHSPKALEARRVQALVWEGDVSKDFEVKAPVVALGHSGRDEDVRCLVDLAALDENPKEGDNLGIAVGRLLVTAARGEATPPQVTVLTKEDE